MWSASFPRLPSQVIIKDINRSFIKTNKSDANAVYHGATISEILYSKRTIFMKKGKRTPLYGKLEKILCLESLHWNWSYLSPPSISLACYGVFNFENKIGVCKMLFVYIILSSLIQVISKSFFIFSVER